MFRKMVEFLSADGWPVAPDTFDGLPCIRTHFIGSRLAWDCRVRPYDPFGQLAFESLLPFTVPAEHRDAVTQLLLRVNWQLLTGAFQLDPDTGELLFRTMLFLPFDEPLSESLCRGVVYSNVLTVDRCLDQFAGAASGADPRQAYDLLAL